MVTLREIPAQKVVAVRFSKCSTEATIAAQTALLRSWMAWPKASKWRESPSFPDTTRRLFRHFCGAARY